MWTNLPTELYPCYVSEMPGEKTRALLVGFFQEAWTHSDSPLLGGFKAGQIAFPAAVVMFESGNIRTVRADAVTVDGAADIFSQYAWLDGDN